MTTAIVDLEGMSAYSQSRHYTSEVSKPSGGKLLEKEIMFSQKALPIGRTMELFKG